jgi:hypothetical protein
MITLAKKSTTFGEITILERRQSGSHIYCQGDWWQSEADRNGVSLAAYVHAIFGLLTQTTAHQVLMIGCGGGTLGTKVTKRGDSSPSLTSTRTRSRWRRNTSLCPAKSLATSWMAPLSWSAAAAN